MCTIFQRVATSIKCGVRAVTTISDSNSGKATKLPICALNIKRNDNLARNSINESYLFQTKDVYRVDPLGILNPSAMELTALHYSSNLNSEPSQFGRNSVKYNVKSLTEILIELPNESKNININDPSTGHNNILYINPLPELRIIKDPTLPGAAKIEEDPRGPVKIEKQAKRQSRMLKIRKKKMKVHRRKRLWKRMWSTWKKKFFNREKNREIAFRHKLIDKVRTAEKFDPEAYVDNYLEDFKFELIPKTYKRKSKPKFLIEQLMDRDEKVAHRKHQNKTHMLTNEPLIKKGETVEEFVERNWK